MFPPANDRVAIGPFTVDLATRRLLRGEVDLQLRPRAFRVLQSLLHDRGRLVGYEDIFR